MTQCFYYLLNNILNLSKLWPEREKDINTKIISKETVRKLS
ncbi:hypothetical protein MtrunA17_Chr2g0319931 [Medicago truncatula]|uniref:Uncharacterized protein n=1 Tax=Medicago truncatula TaxID=3880 RepID=I3SWS7_MEDTR|nr:unknown [Medicago truncatula]RHN75324.1 hypothetical protein MtrunA17_Chr2g0319931 [Medicago truncatula]